MTLSLAAFRRSGCSCGRVEEMRPANRHHWQILADLERFMGVHPGRKRFLAGAQVEISFRTHRFHQFHRAPAGASGSAAAAAEPIFSAGCRVAGAPASFSAAPRQAAGKPSSIWIAAKTGRPLAETMDPLEEVHGEACR